MSNTELDLDAIEAAWWRGERPADVPALVRELREARRELAVVRRETGDGWQVTHGLVERVKMMREAADHWKAMLQDRVKERDEARRERDEARAALAASEKRCANSDEIRDEALGRAERAEAACAQMRAALEYVIHFVQDRTFRTKPLRDKVRAALATDVGSNYVSPTVHAEVVARAELAERDLAYELAKVALAVESADALRAQLAAVTKERDEAQADRTAAMTQNDEFSSRLARCQAQAAVTGAVVARTAEFVRRHAHPTHPLLAELSSIPDAGKRLAERVRLSDEVVAAGRVVLAMPDGESVARRMNVMAAVARLRDALAALDDHDAQGKGSR